MNSREPDLTQAQHSVRNPEVSFDETDLSARAVMLFLVFLGVGVSLLLTGTWGAYRYMAGHYMVQHRTTTPLMTTNRQLAAVGGDPAITFPDPRLQRNGVADWNKFHWEEEAILNSSAVIDPATGTMRIPIQQAIDQIAASGLPTGNTYHRDTETQRKTK
jgi:hypothetical protein